jgi:hypothetical protein
MAQIGSMAYDLHCGGGTRNSCRRIDAGETERSGGWKDGSRAAAVSRCTFKCQGLRAHFVGPLFMLLGDFLGDEPTLPCCSSSSMASSPDSSAATVVSIS